MILMISLTIAFFSAPLSAQQPKINYVYDDLGRLVRVIDENGNAATYHYDSVGNLLRITRETGVPTTAVVSSVSPSSWNRGTNITVAITGYNLSCSSVTAATAGVTLSNVQILLDQIVLNAAVSTTAELGIAIIDLNCDRGLINAAFTVIDTPPTVLITSPAEGAAATEGSQLTLAAQAADNVQLSGIGWTVNGIAYPPIFAPPYQVVTPVPLDVTSLTIEATATDSIGQTASAVRTIAVQPDPPPTVAITSPAGGTSLIEGSAPTLTADAMDNIQVTQLVWSINGIAESPLTGPPYQKVITVPSGITAITIQASASDNYGRTGAASLTLAVLPDPRTTVVGRVVDANNQPVAGASVKAFEQFTSLSQASGAFTIAGVATIRGPILANAEIQTGGIILRGASAIASPVVGGTTDVGTITLRPTDNKTYPGRTFLTGDDPAAMSVADLNGDGRPDVVTVNGSSSDISVLLASGNGFLPDQRYAAGDGPFSGPRSVAFGDLNGDGRVDLVTTNPASDTIAILLGNGDGSFQNQQRLAVGDNPLFVAVADINGDSKFDIIAANRNSGDVSLLLGNGDGSFQPQLRHTAGDGAFLGPIAIAVADINGDGRFDLVSRINASNDISILLGNGDATFQAQLRVPVGASPTAVAVADMNGDNRMDLIVTTSANVVTVFFGNGDGSFQTPQSYPVGASPASLAIVDANGDGIPDIVTANLLSRDISVLLGNGDGTSQTEQRFSVGLRPSSIVAASLDGDSAIDLVLANSGFDNVTLLYGNGNGTFRSRRAFSVGDAPLAVTVADFNGDGKPDIAAANRSSNDLSILQGNGNGTFQTQQRFAVGSLPVAVVTADLNADGRLDVVTANSSTDDVSILLGNGDGTFQPEQRYVVGDTPFALAVGDFNGDGKFDVAAANVISRDISVLLGIGDGTFQPQQRFLLGYPVSGPNSIAVADIDGDGKVDLVAGRNLEGNGDNVIVFIGNGDGTFQLPRPFQGGIGTRSVAVGDLNGDGMMYVAAASTISNDVTVFFGNGDGTLQLAGQIPVDGGDPSVILARDVNDDGKLDLIVVNAFSTVAILHGNGNGTFQNPQYFAAGFGLRSLSVADVNGDGTLDIVTADEFFDEVSVLLRQ
jgi:YD repeat-containing protein